MKNLFLFLLTVSSLLSCNKNTKETDTTNIKTVVFQAQDYFIKPSELYTEAIIQKLSNDKGVVAQEFLQVEQESIQKAKPFFEKAKSLETSNLQQSIHYYQRVLTCYPSVAIYKKLGDLLDLAHEQEEAKSAYQTAIMLLKNTYILAKTKKLDDILALKTPTSKEIYPQLIKTTVATQKFDEVIQILTEVYENGMVTKEFILKDESLKTLRENAAFKLFYALNLAEGEQKIAARRDYFLQSFPKKSLPYNLVPTPPHETIQIYEGGGMYVDGYPENPITEKYDKALKPKDFYSNLRHIAQLHETSEYTLLLTSFDTTSIPSVSDNFRNFTYILFSLDKQGNITDKMPVAYRTPFKEASCNITETGFEIKLFDRQWKNMDYYTARKNNELLGLKFINNKEYQISTNGKFVEKTAEK